MWGCICGYKRKRGGRGTPLPEGDVLTTRQRREPPRDLGKADLRQREQQVQRLWGRELLGCGCSLASRGSERGKRLRARRDYRAELVGPCESRAGNRLFLK